MMEEHRETRISLSLLECEKDLLRQKNHLKPSEYFLKILKLVNSGRFYSLHIDVMRPPLIPDRSTFPIDLIKYIYENFHEKIILEIHLMVKEPNLLVQEINEFIEPRNRKRISMIIQREAYITEEEITNTLRTIKELGYKAGISLNLPTPFNRLTDEMMRDADLVLIMSVPMGKGGQEYDEQATERIKDISNRFPSKPIKVDGGINDMTAQTVKKAGAEIFVVGSYLTKNGDPFGALERIERILKNP